MNTGQISTGFKVTIGVILALALAGLVMGLINR